MTAQSVHCPAVGDFGRPRGRPRKLTPGLDDAALIGHQPVGAARAGTPTSAPPGVAVTLSSDPGMTSSSGPS
jgi:hypothetical protein